MPESKQWVITVVAEGPFNPFDEVSDFMENLRVRGCYDVISYAVTPASEIRSSNGKSNNNSTVAGISTIDGRPYHNGHAWDGLACDNPDHDGSGPVHLIR